MKEATNKPAAKAAEANTTATKTAATKAAPRTIKGQSPSGSAVMLEHRKARSG